MKKIWEAGWMLLAMAGFWGMIYPDLCFTREVCGIVYVDAQEDSSAGGQPEASGEAAVDEDQVKGAPAESAGDLFTQICEAKPGQIRIRFALTANRTDSTDRKEGKGKENVGKEKRRASS